MDQITTSKADAFHALHAPGNLLILANVWDAGSARVVESCGAKALATSSAAVAWACGYADSGALPPRILAEAVQSIVRVIAVPLSVDAEDGYSDDPAAVAETVAALIDAGAVGINLEDGAGSADAMAAKIEAAREAAGRAGVNLFVNARCDLVLRSPDKPDLVEDIVRRAERYRGAGCDGLFVPRLADPAAIRAVVAGIGPLPLNLMAVPGLPDAEGLKALGVRRLSGGSAPAEAVLGLTRHLATEFMRDGRSDVLFRPENTTWSAMNGLFA
ncbi:MAG TPA: isocitrate lyase/phosphoenolpyruvate mutase family protein [Microvirga sp.]|jgi:2-methylisocitrate lyase-like PEP mutase family enzyme